MNCLYSGTCAFWESACIQCIQYLPPKVHHLVLNPWMGFQLLAALTFQVLPFLPLQDPWQAHHRHKIEFHQCSSVFCRIGRDVSNSWLSAMYESSSVYIFRPSLIVEFLTKPVFLLSQQSKTVCILMVILSIPALLRPLILLNPPKTHSSAVWWVLRIKNRKRMWGE